MAKLPIISISVPELRQAYMPGKARTGQVYVGDIGITVYGQRIHRMEFHRNGILRYYSENDRLIGSFQDRAVIDD